MFYKNCHKKLHIDFLINIFFYNPHRTRKKDRSQSKLPHFVVLKIMSYFLIYFPIYSRGRINPATSVFFRFMHLFIFFIFLQVALLIFNKMQILQYH